MKEGYYYRMKDSGKLFSVVSRSYGPLPGLIFVSLQSVWGEVTNVRADLFNDFFTEYNP